MKIGIYGGTFDPIHNGHIELAQIATKQYNLDKVFFIPTGNSYLKQNVTDSALRYEMTKLAIEEFNHFICSDMEIKRTGPSYSYETVIEFRNNFPNDELYFIIGEDSVRNLHIWKNTQLIFENSIVLVAGRKETSDLDIKSQNESTEKHIEQLRKEYDAKISYFEFDNNISSSYIREIIRLSSNDKQLNKYLSKKVIDYITKHQLYK